MDSMELLKRAEELKRLLRICNSASEQISSIDTQLGVLDLKSVQAALNGHEHFSRECLVRKSVAWGIRRVYEEYRDQVWRRIQELSHLITSSVSGGGVDETSSLGTMSNFPANRSSRHKNDELAAPETALFGLKYRSC